MITGKDAEINYVKGEIMKTIDKLNLLSRDEIIELTLSLEDAVKYTLNNLDEAAKDKLITAPMWLQAQLGESAKLMRDALNKLEA